MELPSAISRGESVSASGMPPPLDPRRRLRDPVGVRDPRLSSARGFTLIELMVVMVILGVLSISVFAIYQDLTTKTKVAADDATLGAIRSAVAIHTGRYGALPPSKAVLDTLVTPSPPAFKYYTGYNYDPATGLVTPSP